MKVMLTKYKSTKIQAIKCIRYAMEHFPSLKYALWVVESLPIEIDVVPSHVDDLSSCFEFELSDGSDTQKLFAAWNATEKEKQGRLLQYLKEMGLLSVSGED